MTTKQAITLDQSQLSYDAIDIQRPALRVGQVYKWRITSFESKLSKKGHPMAEVELSPVTESGKVLSQFSQKTWILIPTADLKAQSPKAYGPCKDRYFSLLSAFAAPAFNAFSKIERTETGVAYFNDAGEQVRGAQKTACEEAAKAKMMDARNAFLAGEVIVEGQEAFAPLKPAREGSDYPEVGNFAQQVAPNAVYADTFSEMVG